MGEGMAGSVERGVERLEARARGRDMSGGRWYACYTLAQREKKVEAQFRARGIDGYLPLVPRQRQWHDRKKVVPFPMFPSYIFARFRPDQILTVVSTVGVANLVRFGERLAVIPDAEIENIERFARALGEHGHEPPPVVEFRRGERVRISSGPFAGVDGVVLESRNRARVLVGLESIGLGFEVDVPADSLQSSTTFPPALTDDRQAVFRQSSMTQSA